MNDYFSRTPTRKAVWTVLLWVMIAVGCNRGREMLGSRVLQSQLPPPTEQLPMKLIPQHQGVWCWAATAEMIMTYLGKPVSQCQQASRAPIGLGPCCVPFPPKLCLHSGEPDFARYGFDHAEVTGPSGLSPDKIMQEIGADKRPLGYFNREVGGGGGHIMVISGYDNTASLYLFVLDPLEEIAGLDYHQYVGGAPNYGFEHYRTYYQIRRTQ